MESFHKVMARTRLDASQGDPRDRQRQFTKEIRNKLPMILVAMCYMKLQEDIMSSKDSLVELLIPLYQRVMLIMFH